VPHPSCWVRVPRRNGGISHPTHISSLQDSQRVVSKGMVSEILPNYVLLDGMCKYVSFEHCTHDLPDNHPGKVRLIPNAYSRGLARQSTRTIRLCKGSGAGVRHPGLLPKARLS
jgi:hypothetical protein